MASDARNLILIGYRGTGKSTVARQLGLRLGWPWLDVDVEVEFRAGKSIAAIFADEGEEHFRDLESQVLADLLGQGPRVLAAGGGAVIRPENRAAMQAHGKVVWLTASPETVYERITSDGTTAARRPKLTSYGGLEEIRTLMTKRRPWYQECADLEVNTEGRGPGEIVDEIMLRLGLST